MNTNEINGSPLNTKYFFAAAIPLAIITVLIPLLVLPVTNYLIRGLESFRVVLQWTTILVTFILFLAADIVYWTNGFNPFNFDQTDDPQQEAAWETAGYIYTASWLLALVCLHLRIGAQLRLVFTRRRQFTDRRFWKNNKVLRALILRIFFSVLTVSCMLVGNYAIDGFELLPYFGYFGYKLWRVCQALGNHNLKRTPSLQLERAN